MLLRKQRPDHEYEVLWDGEDQASEDQATKISLCIPGL